MYYVYGHYTRDGRLFYIGKGSRDRAWETRNRNPYWKNVVAKHGLSVRILYHNLTEESALLLESTLINQCGLENLTNIRPGGGGFTSSESRALQLKLSLDPSHRKKLSLGQRRRRENMTSEEKETIRNKCSLAWSSLTPEERKSRVESTSGPGNGMHGKNHTELSKRKMSDKKRGRKSPQTSGINNPTKRPDVRQKMSDAKKRTIPVTCPTCDKTMTPQNYGKWHKNDKCKNRILTIPCPTNTLPITPTEFKSEVAQHEQHQDPER